MAQPGNFTPILLYGSSTPTSVPLAANLTNSTIGSEIAINVADKNLFFKDSGGVVNTVPIHQSGTSSNGWLSSTDWNTFNGKAPGVTFTTGYVPFGQGTTSLNQSANLFFDGTNLSVTGSITPSQTAGIIGTTTSNDANTGSVGQYIEATFSVVTVTTTSANMTSISLTAGDWDVSFRISSGGASGTCTCFYYGINTTSATLGTQGINYLCGACDTVNGGVGGSIPSKRISIASTTTVYGVASCIAGTIVYTTGVLSARRVR